MKFYTKLVALPTEPSAMKSTGDEISLKGMVKMWVCLTCRIAQKGISNAIVSLRGLQQRLPTLPPKKRLGGGSGARLAVEITFNSLLAILPIVLLWLWRVYWPNCLLYEYQILHELDSYQLSSQHFINPYEILELSPHSNSATLTKSIKRAYRRLMLQHYPPEYDTNDLPTSAAPEKAKMFFVSMAFEILTDAESLANWEQCGDMDCTSIVTFDNVRRDILPYRVLVGLLSLVWVVLAVKKMASTSKSNASRISSGAPHPMRRGDDNIWIETEQQLLQADQDWELIAESETKKEHKE